MALPVCVAVVMVTGLPSSAVAVVLRGRLCRAEPPCGSDAGQDPFHVWMVLFVGLHPSKGLALSAKLLRLNMCVFLVCGQ